MSSSRALSLWLPVVLWAGLIFGLSSIPSLDSGLGTWDEVLRKSAHVTEYAILGLLLLRALVVTAAARQSRAAASSRGKRRFPLELPLPTLHEVEVSALLLGIAYAASDELHQRFVAGRHGSPVDVAIDAAGLLLGILLVRRTIARA